MSEHGIFCVDLNGRRIPHGPNASPCPVCQDVGYMRSRFDAAGVPPESLACSYVLAVTAAAGGFEEVARAFRDAGREAQELVAAAFALGGGNGVRAAVKQLTLPGVWVNEFGAVCWVAEARAAGVGVEL